MQVLASGSTTNPDIDRVVIPIGNTGKPVNVAMDFTVEFWMKTKSRNKNANGCNPNEWYFGNVIIDRDVFGDGEYGDYGIVLCNRRIVVGVQRNNPGYGGMGGNTIVDDGVWHHIAVTRQASSGGVWLNIDDILDASSSSSLSTGDICYKVGRSTMYPHDPTLVFGAQKHDYQSFLYFKGKLDECRISNIKRYTSSFTPPIQAFISDASTFALYYFNDGSGTTLTDVSGASGGPSHGTIQYSGNPSGPTWSYDSPFHPALEVTNTADTRPGTLRQIISEAPSGSLIVFSPSLQNLTVNLNSSIAINKALIVEDKNTASITVHANGAGPVFLVEATASSVVLKSFKIRSCHGTNGRCIHNQGTLRLENMLIEDLTPGNGSCILNTGNLEIVGSVVVD